MKNLLFISVIFVFVISCMKSNDKVIAKYGSLLTNAGFDLEYWRKDSLGCDAQKKVYQAKILANQDFLNSCRKAEIIKLLGNPYRISSKNENVELYYIIDGRLMCDNLLYKNVIRDEDNSYIIIAFNRKDSLLDMRLIVK